MARRAGAAALAALAAVAAVPLLVRAAPPQVTAAGVILPAGAAETIVLDRDVDSDNTLPGTTVPAHLRAAIVLRGRIVVPSGKPVRLVVTETRRSADGIGGEIFLRAESLEIAEGLAMPLRLVHPVLSAPLIARNRVDVVLPPHAKQPADNGNLVLPAGTLLLARTGATLDASHPDQLTVSTPAPYIISTDRPYSAYTPIPLTTLNPNATQPPRRRKGRHTPPPAPSASPSPYETLFPTETSSPAANLRS